MVILVVVILIAFVVLIGWMWQNLGDVEIKTKIICILLGLAITYIITFIIYNISKIGIEYDSIEVMKTIRRVYVALFTIINGYILLPYTFKTLNKINNEEIKKEQVKKKIIILFIIILCLAIFESMYLESIQKGILTRAE